MIRIYLTDFVDIASKVGTPKFTKVRQIKERPEYEPAFDFYRPLREKIIEAHVKNYPKKYLDIALKDLHDRKKLTNYPAVLAGYKKWWGNKKFQWFDPPRQSYNANGVEVVINPEIGLIFNEKRYIIKLFFKSNKLSKTMIDTSTHLMELSLRKACKESENIGVLDVRNSNLLLFDGKPIAKAMIDAELAYVSAIWESA